MSRYASDSASVVSDSVLRQTPTFNAPAAVAGCLAAVKRGVKVVLYLNLGFNDASERLPKQGGTNEQVVKHMYSALKSDEEKERLHIYWYVAKDMAEPIHACMLSSPSLA